MFGYSHNTTAASSASGISKRMENIVKNALKGDSLNPNSLLSDTFTNHFSFVNA